MADIQPEVLKVPAVVDKGAAPGSLSAYRQENAGFFRGLINSMTGGSHESLPDTKITGLAKDVPPAAPPTVKDAPPGTAPTTKDTPPGAPPTIKEVPIESTSGMTLVSEKSVGIGGFTQKTMKGKDGETVVTTTEDGMKNKDGTDLVVGQSVSKVVNGKTITHSWKDNAAGQRTEIDDDGDRTLTVMSSPDPKGEGNRKVQSVRSESKSTLEFTNTTYKDDGSSFTTHKDSLGKYSSLKINSDGTYTQMNDLDGGAKSTIEDKKDSVRTTLETGNSKVRVDLDKATGRVTTTTDKDGVRQTVDGGNLNNPDGQHPIPPVAPESTAPKQDSGASQQHDGLGSRMYNWMFGSPSDTTPPAPQPSAKP